MKTRSRATLHRPVVNNFGPSISLERGNCARGEEMSRAINASVHGQGIDVAERNLVVPGGDTESLDRNSVEPEGDVARHTLRVKEALGALTGPSNRPVALQNVLGPRYFVTKPVDPISLISSQPTISNPLVSPIQIEEVSPNSSPIRNDLRTKVVDDCMSTVFNWLTLKRKACEDDDEGRSPKLLKCAALTDVLLQPSQISTTLSQKHSSVWSNSRSKRTTIKPKRYGQKLGKSGLFEVKVELEKLTQAKELLSCSQSSPNPSEPDEYCSQVPIECGAIQLTVHWSCGLVEKLKTEEDRASCLGIVAWIGWFIWKDRNNYVFNHLPVEPSSTLHRARVAMVEFENAILNGLTKKEYISSSFQGEALACRWACIFAQACGLQGATIEGDNKLVILLSVSETVPSWEYGLVIDDIRRLASQEMLILQWSPRSANSVAHWVAQASLHGYLPQDWVSNPPAALATLSGAS
ncbi:hypothetical protein LOK49_LG01G02084 [Camellia lanceoleosa]|uniref:Uncharacterized protein n=1 Tax=Camellia lanceoleosa TaxID=1840588 RepID=A0ACC0J4C6_9ERIC|nr:hypothetical protein LOK49_LG01G02084 [Camellia lanceoleosa]